jgi:hypothetical protein
MKQIILTLAGAENANVDSQVLNAFKNEFNAAQEVKWTESSDYYKASFIFNGQYVAAFYSHDGELMGITRYITSLELPVKLQTSLKKNYSAYWISDLFEVSNSEGVAYYVTLENADKKIVLKSAGNSWDVYKSTEKL